MDSGMTIVVVAYNRLRALSRLLVSLKNANYDGDAVRLFISIDKGDNDEVVKAAEDFDWPFGEKIIHCNPAKMGLRNHILQCGDLTEKYGHVIVLEDDLYVSPLFYIYAKQAASFYENDPRIAGISLYSHQFNVHAYQPFVFLEDGSDVYFLQFASSWGQIWSRRQWQEFRVWYRTNNGTMGSEPDVPRTVSSWPDSSWLKYFIRFVIKTNKYFVYPKVSLSTNFSESGTHVVERNTAFQVPIYECSHKIFTFCTLDSSRSVYDAFFESVTLKRYLEQMGFNDCNVDFYCQKGRNLNNRYWLTPSNENYHLIHSYALDFRPYELNVIKNNHGDEIFLYDTQIEQRRITSSLKLNSYLRVKYQIKYISVNEAWLYLFYSVRRLITNKINGIKKRK